MEGIRFDNLMKVLQQYGNDVVNTYKSSLEDNDKKASGKLISSVSCGIDINGVEYEVYLNLADYWKYVENGRGKTKNGGDGELRRNILTWIRAKQILPRPDKKTGKLPTESQLAYLISRSIHENGTKNKGRGILEGTLNTLNQKYLPLIQDAIQKDLTNSVSDMLNIIQFRK